MRFTDCLFDLYGTLVDIHTDESSPPFWRQMARWYQRQGARYAPTALKDAYFETVRRLEAASEAAEGWPEIRIEEVFRHLYLAAGVPAGEELVVRTGRKFRLTSLEYLRLYDGAEELLHSLRRAGLRVRLLSNAQRLFTMPELEGLGLTPLFDSVSLSSDYGVKKPDPRFYQRVLAEFSIDPKTAVMVGNDGLCDILGAKAAGLSTVYLRSNLSPEEPPPPADWALPEMDLAAVAKILLSA